MDPLGKRDGLLSFIPGELLLIELKKDCYLELASRFKVCLFLVEPPNEAPDFIISCIFDCLSAILLLSGLGLSKQA